MDLHGLAFILKKIRFNPLNPFDLRSILFFSSGLSMLVNLEILKNGDEYGRATQNFNYRR